MKRTLADPYLERMPTPFASTYVVMGAPIHFASNRRWLCALADDAFANLPTSPSGRSAPLHIRLLANDDLPGGTFEQPPEQKLYANAELMLSMLSSADAVLCAPASGSALVTVSEAMREFPYHVRYEMIEQAAYLLASRCTKVVNLHAGCVTREGRGTLLFGKSGAGKSTLTFACLTQGWSLVSEDGAYIVPGRKLRVRGVPNFIHLMDDAVRFFDPKLVHGKRIQRRSGRAKIEIDARKHFIHALRTETLLHNIVFVEPPLSENIRATLTAISPTRARRLMIQQQPYSSLNPKWDEALKALSHLPAYLLRPGNDVHESVALLEGI